MVNVTKSTRAIKGEEIERKWHIVDVGGKTLGREIPGIAALLMGKNKVNYVPYLDNGDHVIVINAKDVKVTGKKENQKEYQNYSGYPGGRKVRTFKEVMDKDPEKVVRTAVTGMLPKNKLRDKRLARLHVFPEAHHPFQDKVIK